MATPSTRSKSPSDKAKLKHVLTVCVGVPNIGYDASDVVLPLTQAGIIGFTDLISLSDDDLSTITIPTNDPKDYQLPLPVIARRKIMIAVAFFHSASRTHKGPVNIMQLTKVMFDTYRTSEYDATEPVKPWNISPPVTNSDLTAWSKNIRPQANDYKEFKDEA